MSWAKYRSIFFYFIVFFCITFATVITSITIAIASDCKPKSIQTSPEKKLTIEKGKSANVTVKLKCKDGSPASGVTIETKVLKGNKNISFTPKSSVTDNNGKAVFTITGDKKTTEGENAEIKFKAEKLKTTLEIKVQAEECKLDSLKTNPENKLTLVIGQSSEITVRAKCKNGSPAVDIKIDAIIQKGNDNIELSPSAELTDENGKAVFTVSGIKKTRKEAASIKFSADNIKTVLDVKVKKETEAEETTEEASETTTEEATEEETEEEASDEETEDTSLVKEETTIEETTETESTEGTIEEEASETTTEEVAEEEIEEEASDEETEDASTVEEETTEDESEESTSEETVTEEEAEESVSEEETSTDTTKTTTADEISEESIECKPKLIITHPDKKLTLEKGKTANIVVKVKCKGEIPAEGINLEAHVKKGKKYITLSPKTAVTDENGKAVFTVSGDKKTDAEPAEIKFKAEKLHTTLEVKVQAETCSLGSLKTNPEKKLKLKEDESSKITVKAKCKNGSPAVDVKIDAIVQGNSGKVEISPSGELTDEAGKAVFTVTGIKKTSKKDTVKIKFSSGDLKSMLDINVQ